MGYIKNIGMMNGIYKEYWGNGQLWEEVNYINDKKEGILKVYHRYGRLQSEVNYIILMIRKMGFIGHIMKMGN